MASTIKAFENGILLRFEELFEPLGFSKRSEQSYYKQLQGISQVIHLSFIRHKSDVDFTIDVAVRHDALEMLVNEFENTVRPVWGRLSSKEMCKTATVGALLENISDQYPRRFTVAALEDIGGACARGLETVQAIGIPSLERLSSLDAIFSVLRRDDEEGRRYCPFLDVRAIKAIAAAFLLGQKGLFDEVVRTKLAFLSAKNADRLADVTRFAEQLGSRFTSR